MFKIEPPLGVQASPWAMPGCSRDLKVSFGKRAGPSNDLRSPGVTVFEDFSPFATFRATPRLRAFNCFSSPRTPVSRVYS